MPMLKQLRDLWQNLPTPDAVDQVFQGHFFPFIIQIWGGTGLDPKEAKPFFLLYDTAMLFARRNMSKKALEFKQRLIEENIISGQDTRPLAVQVCEVYQNLGFDSVLVGMRKKIYVDMMKPLFPPTTST
jgi:hypothetical protein